VADLHSGPASPIFTADDVYVDRTSPRSSARLLHEIRGRAGFRVEGLAGKMKLLGKKIDDVDDLLRERLPHGGDSDFRGRSIASAGSL
jgi:hypothetical protein